MSLFHFQIELADGKFIEYSDIDADDEHEALEILEAMAFDDGYDVFKIHKEL